MSLDTRQFGRTVRLTEQHIHQRLRDAQLRGWALVIEHAGDADPHTTYWDRWGTPICDPDDPATALFEINACRASFPSHYIRVNACERDRGQARIRDSLLVYSPESPLDSREGLNN